MNSEANPQRTNDHAAIAALVQSQAEAWNRADAEAFAAHYAEDGSFTNIAGARFYGKAGFVKQHETILRTIFAGSRIAFTVDTVRFVRPDVAVVEIDSALTGVRSAPVGAGLGSDGTLHSRLQEVWTREDGRWQIAAFHNVAVVRMQGH